MALINLRRGERLFDNMGLPTRRFIEYLEGNTDITQTSIDDIETNSTNIAINTNNITTNSTNISTNSSNITTNSNDIASHKVLTSGVHGTVGSVVGTTDTQTLTNKTLIDASTFIADDGDNTKLAKFEAVNITSGQTRTITIPDKDITLIGVAARNIKLVEFVDSPYTATINDYTILVDATNGVITVNLPTAASAYNSTDSTGVMLTIKRVATDTSGNTVTVDGDGVEKIDNSLTQVLSHASALKIQSDGTQWHIV